MLYTPIILVRVKEYRDVITNCFGRNHCDPLVIWMCKSTWIYL